MSDDSATDKTEQATPRKLEQAKEKGQIARNKDLVSMTTIGGSVLLFYIAGTYFFTNMANMMGSMLSMNYGLEPMHLCRVSAVFIMKLLAPFFLISVVLAILANVMQGGFVKKDLEIKFDKLNPIEGFKKFFSLKSFNELLKTLLKFGAGGWVVYYIINKNLKVMPNLAAMHVNDIVLVSGRMILDAIVIAYSFYMFIAILSYFLEKWEFDRSQKMTKQEIRDENKETEGDPIIKSRIRSLQREAARKRMMQEVPKATVVITNPQHLAIAIKYEDNKMFAPKIVAKGAGVIAARIKEIAKEHGVPIVEDKPVARSLFKLELNSFIPEELYVAVARILAYIYKLKGTL